VINGTEATHALLCAFLSGSRGGDGGWSLLAPRIDHLDALTDFERMVLPLAYDLWRGAGRSVTNLSVLRGIHRKTIVRNRVFVVECERLLARLRAAGVDALAFKSGALLGRMLPGQGLRAISDIDLWVRPCHYEAAIEVLGRGGERPRRGVHATTIEMQNGLDVDLHVVPTHWHAALHRTTKASERLFEGAWLRRTRDALSDGDLLYYSFLNPLFNHAPGESRAAFALIELDIALDAGCVTDEVLRDVGRRVQEDRSAAVFLEHYQWLGKGASSSIDRFIGVAVRPAAERRDVEVARWLASGAVRGGWHDETTAWFRSHVRAQALLVRKPPGGRYGAYLGIAQRFFGTFRRDPGMLLVWAFRKSSWRRLRQISFDIMRRPIP